MQPNQQNPAPQIVPSSQSPNVPDYLHMEPVVDDVELARKQRKKKRMILLIVISLITLVVGTGVAYWYIEQNKPQERLYRALESELSVKYVNKKTTYHKDGTGKGTNVEVDSTVDLSDLSNVSSESAIDFSRQIKRNGIVADDEYSIRLIKRAKLNLYIESYSGQTDLNGLDKKKWITSDPVKGNINSRLEEFDVSTIIYGSQLVPVMGNYDSVLRSKIMDTIRSNGMYKVIDTVSKDADGKSLTGMRIGVDRDAINKLNKTIATESELGVTYNLLRLINGTNYEDIILWVDNKNTIVEVDYRNGLDKDHIRITNKTVFTYLDKAIINEPNK